MLTDDKAPLQGRAETIINAPIEQVWQILTDFAAWPQWQPGVTQAALEGSVQVGSVLHGKASGLGIISTLREVEACHKISWTGDSLGMHAIHNWIMEPVGGSTRVITEESISGWFARLLKLSNRNYMQASLNKSLEVLKKRSEAIA